MRIIKCFIKWRDMFDLDQLTWTTSASYPMSLKSLRSTTVPTVLPVGPNPANMMFNIRLCDRLLTEEWYNRLPDDLIRTEPTELVISNCRRRDSRLTVAGDSITLTMTMMSAVVACLMKENTCWLEVRPVKVKLCLTLAQRTFRNPQ